jgi:hypothetical protein
MRCFFLLSSITFLISSLAYAADDPMVNLPADVIHTFYSLIPHPIESRWLSQVNRRLSTLHPHLNAERREVIRLQMKDAWAAAQQRYSIQNGVVTMDHITRAYQGRDAEGYKILVLQASHLNLNSEYFFSKLKDAYIDNFSDVFPFLVRKLKGKYSFEITYFLFSSSISNSIVIDHALGLLVAVGLDVDAVSKYHSTVATLFARNGQWERLQLLMKHGASLEKNDVHFTPLLAAAKEGQVKTVQELIRSGADINAQAIQAERKDFIDGSTALHFAVFAQDLKLVRLLLECGAKRDIQDGVGRTPLDLARQHSTLEIVELLEKGHLSQPQLESLVSVSKSSL